MPGQGGHLGTREKLAGDRHKLALELCIRRRASQFIRYPGPGAGDGSPARRRLSPSTKGRRSGNGLHRGTWPRRAWRSHHPDGRAFLVQVVPVEVPRGGPLPAGVIEDSVLDSPDGLVQLVRGVTDLAARGVIAH